MSPRFAQLAAALCGILGFGVRPALKTPRHIRYRTYPTHRLHFVVFWEKVRVPDDLLITNQLY